MTTPLFMRDVSLSLTLISGTAAEYNCDAHLAAIETKAGDAITYQTLCADGSFSETGQSSYALHIVAAQIKSGAIMSTCSNCQVDGFTDTRHING